MAEHTFDDNMEYNWFYRDNIESIQKGNFWRMLSWVISAGSAEVPSVSQGPGGAQDVISSQFMLLRDHIGASASPALLHQANIPKTNQKKLKPKLKTRLTLLYHFTFMEIVK